MVEVVEDAFLLFWDVRSEAMLGGYWDSFGMDVTSGILSRDSTS